MEGSKTKIISVASTTFPSGAAIMATGQTVSFASGDDGDIQAGRSVDFFTLPSAPVHLDNSPTANISTNRFTDELGNQNYDEKIVIDWSTFNGSTVLGYNCNDSFGVNSWIDVLNSINSVVFAGFANWRMINIKEITNIWCMDSSVIGEDLLDYYPFSFSLNQRVATWLSTANPKDITELLYSANGNNRQFILTYPRASGISTSIAVRDFRVIGTALI